MSDKVFVWVLLYRVAGSQGRVKGVFSSLEAAIEARGDDAFDIEQAQVRGDD